MEKPKKKVKLTISHPVIDGDLKIRDEFSDFVSTIKSNTDKSYDNEQHTHLHVVVDGYHMIPTAVYFSFSTKLNITVTVDVHEFEGSHYVYSYLVRSALDKVTWRGR